MTSDADLITQAASMIRTQDLYGWSSEHDRIVLDALDAFSASDAEGKGTTLVEKAPATGTSPEQMLAMLRHAYEQIVHDAMGDLRRFADGLIAPVIRGLETHVMFTAISDPKNAYLFTADAALEAFDAQPPLPKEKPERAALIKADTRALWHAVNNAGYMVRALAEDPRQTTPEEVQAEKDLLLQAKRALRKVNALRKEGR